MSADILCTLGPASLHPRVIVELDAHGVSLFRINLSHTRPEALEVVIDRVQRHTQVPICLDTEGAQVRCGVMTPGVLLVRGRAVTLTAAEVIGTAEVIPLRPASAIGQLQVGSVVGLGFDGVELNVTRVGEESADAVVVEGGRLDSNKAVTFEPRPHLPPLTEHDIASIRLGVEKGIRHVALSFAGSGEDVALLRELMPPDAYVIAKVESRAGIDNIGSIADAADAVLIDRGDLSHDVPIEQVPLFQKYLVRRANAANRPVFVATNLLESMVVNRTPTLAEANDIINTLADGAHGLVLAAETAIGSHPVQSVDMVRRLIRAFEDSMVAPSLVAHADAVAV